MQAEEVTRVMLAHALKALGTTSDTYEMNQMLQATNSLLLKGGHNKTIARMLRNWALFLLPIANLFCRDNLQRLRLSDLSFHHMLNPYLDQLDKHGWFSDIHNIEMSI
uniref:Uncharacterized protein n=1 Tax=Moniliophthora roreri TaxID=221103 RepID=A0A0W0FC76_MONRR